MRLRLRHGLAVPSLVKCTEVLEFYYMCLFLINFYFVVDFNTIT